MLHGIVNHNMSTLQVHIYQYTHLHKSVKIGHSDPNGTNMVNHGFRHISEPNFIEICVIVHEKSKMCFTKFVP